MLADALGRALRLDDAFDFDHTERVVHGADASARICESVRPDVLLLDPDGEPPTATFGVLRRVKAVSPDTKILLLVPSRNEDALTVDYIEAGADGFVDRAESFDDVVNRLRAAAAGATVISQGEVVGVLRKAAREREVTRRVAERLRALTDRELEILRLIGDGLSNDDIAASLHISAHTVATHIQNLFRKMDVHSRAQAVAVANKTGSLRIDETA